MIVEALAEARRGDVRGDEHLAHVADLYGCDRATFYRRSGHVAPPHDDAKLRKFDVGHAVEAQIIARLRDRYDVYSGELIGLWLDNAGKLVGSRLVSVEEVGSPAVIGHPDAWVDDGGAGTLLEIKTTDVRKPHDVVPAHYAIQAAAYAIARGADRAIVHTTHVVPFEKPEREYEIDVEALRPRVAQRVHEVLENTRPNAPLPAARPEPESAAWMCRYCSYKEQCDFDGGPSAK